MPPVRTRFAPSPTGYLHIGGARTALYNWLFAKRNGGVFILRVEDTDKERSTDANTREILEGMKWLGLDWDEGPILQSSRTETYRSHVEQLLKAGKAYRCYCTKEELETKRKAAEAAKTPYRYDRTCRHRTTPPPAGVPYGVRIAFPEDGDTTVHDLIKGDVTQANRELSDEYILRSDGSPVYNLCVVVDDAEMKISHVLRGDDHLMNTFKQIQLYRAFGYELPLFGHLPLIFGPDGKKLSKRKPPKDPTGQPIKVAVAEYRDAGYLPEAMLNFLVRIGWARGDEEIFDKKRLLEVFELSGIGKAPGQYDLKRLDNLGATWIKAKPAAELGELLVPYLEKRGWKRPDGKTLAGMVACTRERSRTLVEMAEQVSFWFTDEAALAFDPKAVEKFLKGKGDLVAAAADALAGLEPFDDATVEGAIKSLAEKRGAKMGDVAQPLRVAVTGSTVSPPLHNVIALLGKPRVAARLAKAKARA